LAQTLFRTVENGLPPREVILEGSAPGSYLTGYVEWQKASGLGTGIAVVFLGDQPRVSNQINLRIVGQTDEHPIEEAYRQCCLLGMMVPGEHRAFFLSDLFPEIEEFRGTAILQGTSDFVAALLRTRDGAATSSLSAVSTN
jgi:hypothetical protein